MAGKEKFSGFPKAAFDFFAHLKKNNTREWFSAHKTEYEKNVLEPAKAFILTLGSRLHRLHPDLGYDTSTNGTGSIFRIYRDVRFSADKSPYKTNLGIYFWLGGGSKKESTAGYYYGMSDGPPHLYAGRHVFPKPVLDAFREAVADKKKGGALKSIIARLEKNGFTMDGEYYKRVPMPYKPDHPNADLLRYNSLTAMSPEIPVSVVTSGRLLQVAYDHCKAMAPLNRWLSELAQR